MNENCYYNVIENNRSCKGDFKVADRNVRPPRLRGKADRNGLFDVFRKLAFVIPVKTGIQIAAFLDTRLRGYDRD